MSPSGSLPGWGGSLRADRRRRRGQHIHRRRGKKGLYPGDPDPGYAELLLGEITMSRALGDDVVGWWNNPKDEPDCLRNNPPVNRSRDILRIVRPPAEPTETTPFIGRIESIGIGPVGDRRPGPFPPRLGRVGRDPGWGERTGSRTSRTWHSRTGTCDISVRQWPRPPRRVGRRGLRARRLPGTRASGGTAPMASSGPLMPLSLSEHRKRAERSALRPASAMSWACRMASSRAGTVPTLAHFQPAAVQCGIHQTVPPGATSAIRRRRRPRMGQSCCHGWAARSSATGSDDSTSGPPRALLELPMAAELPAAWKQANSRDKHEIWFGTAWSRDGRGKATTQRSCSPGMAWLGTSKAMPAEMEADQTFPLWVVERRRRRPIRVGGAAVRD